MDGQWALKVVVAMTKGWNTSKTKDTQIGWSVI